LLSLKLDGNDPYWTTFPSGQSPSQASYANFTYSYTTTPAVKTISNTNINVLSATATTDDTSNATLVLNNPTASTDSTNIVLGSYDRPFSGYITTIGSDGTATVASGSIAAGATATLNSVKLDIVPNAGTIAVSNITWNTSGTYSKAWTESGSGGVSSATHTVGDLQSNKKYVVRVDGSIASSTITGANGTTCSNAVCTSNSSGQISFNYTGGYSNHTFNVDPPSAPTVTLSAASNVTATSATINGNVTDNGGENPTVTMYYGTTDGGQTPANWANSPTPTSPAQPQGIAAFYTNITGLSPNTTYYFSAQATNSGGTSWPAASLNFTTLANVPLAPTMAASSTTGLSTTINENSNPSNTTFSIQVGSQYVQANGTLGSSAVYQTKSAWGSPVNISGLSANTQYIVSVNAENGAGVPTNYSSTSSKYTLAPTPTNLTATAATTSVTLSVDTLSNATSGSSGYCFSPSGTTCSNWIQTNTWQDTGLLCGTSYSYSVKYRNGDGTETSSISTSTQTLSCNTGGGNSLFLLPSAVYNPPSAPQVGFRLSINSGSATTSFPTVTLSLTAGSDTKNMAISNFADFHDAGQEPYQETKTWNLCGQQTSCPSGSYTVYAKFYTSYGQPSQTVSGSIVLNPQAPNQPIPTQTAPNQPSSTNTTQPPTLTLGLNYGSNNSQVTLLQDILKKLGFFPSNTKSNGHFGPATLKAVEAFQLQHGIAKPSQVGYGYVGPKTRALLNSMEK
jgi:hypothetical protein